MKASRTFRHTRRLNKNVAEEAKRLSLCEAYGYSDSPWTRCAGDAFHVKEGRALRDGKQPVHAIPWETKSTLRIAIIALYLLHFNLFGLILIRPSFGLWCYLLVWQGLWGVRIKVAASLSKKTGDRSGGWSRHWPDPSAFHCPTYGPLIASPIPGSSTHLHATTPLSPKTFLCT